MRLGKRRSRETEDAPREGADGGLTDRILFVGFVASLVLAGFGFGIAAGIFGWPPAPALRSLYEDARTAALYWENDLGLEPSRHLVDGYPGRRERFAVHDPQRLPEGLFLISGLTPERSALNSVVLTDMQGNELHEWPVDYREIDPDGRPPQNVFLHGLQPFEDGSIIVNFDSGNAIARVGACGGIRWSRSGDFHHVVTRSHDGTIWTWHGEGIAQLDPEDGRILREIGLVEDVLLPHRLQGVLGIRTEESPEKDLVLSHDPFHGNHVEALAPELAGAFPLFEAGDLLISMRNLNMVAVMDPESHDLKWWRIGPWHRQHQPRFRPDGSILVYNNDMGFGPSQILKVFPDTGRIEVVFEGSDETPFFSWRRGKHEVLNNGDLLITESERGRAFIITPAGEIVWEYNNVYDETRNGVLNKAMLLPADFFEEGALRCP